MIERQDPKTLVKNLQVDAKALATDNVALAKAEITPMAKNAGIGGGMFGAAGYFGINALSLIWMGCGLALGAVLVATGHFGLLMGTALGFFIMAVVLLVIAGVLALVGKSKISKLGKPEKTIAEAQKTVEAVKTSAKRGVDEVNAFVRDRKGLAADKKAAKDLDTTVAPARAAGTVPTVTNGSGAHEAH